MRRLLLSIVLVAAVLTLSAGAFAGKIVLPEKTEIKIKFDPAMEISSGRLQAGVTVAIYLAEDIKIGGKTIVEAGAEGTAKVEEAVGSGRPGKPGKIKLTFVELAPKGPYSTAGNEMIKVAGVAEDEGGSKKLLSWLFIFGFFIKGGQGEIDTTLEYPATIAETIILESAN